MGHSSAYSKDMSVYMHNIYVYQNMHNIYIYICMYALCTICSYVHTPLRTELKAKCKQRGLSGQSEGMMDRLLKDSLTHATLEQLVEKKAGKHAQDKVEDEPKQELSAEKGKERALKFKDGSVIM